MRRRGRTGAEDVGTGAEDAGTDAEEGVAIRFFLGITKGGAGVEGVGGVEGVWVAVVVEGPVWGIFFGAACLRARFLGGGDGLRSEDAEVSLP